MIRITLSILSKGILFNRSLYFNSTPISYTSSVDTLYILLGYIIPSLF